jgi:RNA polymerase sigma-70 factor (ECF subfamily)
MRCSRSKRNALSQESRHVLSDQTLIQRCLDGHADDYRLLIDRHASAVRGLLRQRLADGHATEDAAAETFARAYFLLDRLRQPDAFRSWLLGIAERIARERRRQRHPIVGQIDERAIDPAEARPRDGDHDLQRAVQALPERARQIVRLRYVADMSCRQIAAHLNVPLGTVTKQLSRAYVLLREALANDTDHPRQSSLEGSTNHAMPRVPGRDCGVAR